MSDYEGFEEADYGKKMDWKLWGKLFRYARPLRPIMIALAGLMVVVAIIDGVFPQMTRYAIDVILPQIHAALNGGASSVGAASAVGDGASAVGGAIPTNVVWFIVGYILLAALQGFNVWGLIAIAGIIEVRLCYELRDRAFRNLQALSFSYYDKTPAGWIMARMSSDTMRLGETIAWGLVDLVWGSAMIMAIIGFMFAMNWKLAFIAMAILPPLVVATAFFQKRILAAQRKARKTNSLISGAFNEGLQGARTSKTLVAEAQNTLEFTRLTGTMKAASVHAARLSSLYLPIVIFLSTFGAGLALGVGGGWVIAQWISYGTLVAFLSYAMSFFDPAREVARVLSEFQAAQASAERLLSLVETQPEIQDSPEVLERYGDALNPRKENWEEIRGEVVFDHVDFSYGVLEGAKSTGEKESAEGEDKDFEVPTILEDFSLKIPSGQTLAVVGETGSGKSTLVNLLCRFYEPTKGRILIDGKDYKDRSQHWLHSRLGYVLQTPHLFAGTIRDNIRYGRLEATDAAVETAAEQANAMHFIGKLEKGLDTTVGEGGVLLSTGEKQLVSLARALLADPAIMILDEATSSIDTEAEALIQGAVERVLKGRTSVVIAHRLSTIRKADRILVMAKGKILEDGNHAELLAARGYYWRLYTRQFLDEESMEAATAV